MPLQSVAAPPAERLQGYEEVWCADLQIKLWSIPERFECELLQIKRYINPLTFTIIFNNGV